MFPIRATVARESPSLKGRDRKDIFGDWDFSSESRTVSVLTSVYSGPLVINTGRSWSPKKCYYCFIFLCYLFWLHAMAIAPQDVFVIPSNQCNATELLLCLKPFQRIPENSTSATTTSNNCGWERKNLHRELLSWPLMQISLRVVSLIWVHGYSCVQLYLLRYVRF